MHDPEDEGDDGQGYQCCECDQKAVGFMDGSPFCANCYRGRPAFFDPPPRYEDPPDEPDDDSDADTVPEPTPIVVGDDPDQLDIPEPDIGGEGRLP